MQRAVFSSLALAGSPWPQAACEPVYRDTAGFLHCCTALSASHTSVRLVHSTPLQPFSGHGGYLHQEMWPLVRIQNWNLAEMCGWGTNSLGSPCPASIHVLHLSLWQFVPLTVPSQVPLDAPLLHLLCQQLSTSKSFSHGTALSLAGYSKPFLVCTVY